MRILTDDPRLTAYALGELEPAEQAAIEAALNESPEARAELEEIRCAAAVLTDELRSESAPALTASQRAAIISRNGQANLAPKLHRTSRLFVGFASLAACILAAVGLTWHNRPLNLKEWALSHKPTEPTPAPPPSPVADNVEREVIASRPIQLAAQDSSEIRQSATRAPAGKTDEDMIPWHHDIAYPKQTVTESAARASSNPPSSILLATNGGGGLGGGGGGLGSGGGGLGAGGASPDPAILSTARQYRVDASGFRDMGGPSSPPIEAPALTQGMLATGAPRAATASATPQAGWKTVIGSEATMPGYASNPNVIPSPALRGEPVLRRAFANSREGDQFLRQNNLAAAATQPCFAPTNTESYNPITDNPFLRVTDSPLSTFSIDVDTASYANTRRFLNSGRLPPADAVRIEEMINYFNYDYAQPDGDAPFSVNAEMAECPWSPRHRLLRVGLRGKSISQDRQPATNLVFLIDVSGSMQPENKLPLLQKALGMLVRKLNANDRVAIVVYAGASGLALPSTSGDHQDTILAAIDRLNAGGSTNGAAGIQLAYDTARANFIQGGVNRVILATDGDFNVGITSEGDLTRLIEEQAKSGVFLSVLGFGMDNLKDSTLETLADKGNGNYAYIDTPREARKALVEQLAGTLFTIAKDVKIQIEFNPAKVGAYRLIGYENRILAAQDFNDDRKDAGEIGAGHTVTALYEIVPVGESINAPGIDPLKYQQPPAVAVAPGGTVAASNETCTVKLRYKEPDGQTSRLLEVPVTDLGNKFATASTDFKFAAAVAGFGMQLRGSPFKGDWTLAAVQEVAQESRGNDITEYRTEFIDLVKKARGLMGQAGN